MNQTAETLSAEELAHRTEVIKKFLGFSFANEGQSNFADGASNFTVGISLLNEIHGMAVRLLGLNPVNDADRLKSLSENPRWIEFCANPSLPTVPHKVS